MQANQLLATIPPDIPHIKLTSIPAVSEVGLRKQGKTGRLTTGEAIYHLIQQLGGENSEQACEQILAHMKLRKKILRPDNVYKDHFKKRLKMHEREKLETIEQKEKGEKETKGVGGFDLF